LFGYKKESNVDLTPLQLAYEAHGKKQDDEADLSRGDLLALLEPGTYLGSAGLAAEFLDYVDRRAGMLVGHGGAEENHLPQIYTFPHRTFQEYLAGCHLVRGRGIDRTFWRLVREEDYWYVAGQLGAEELLYNRQNPESLLDLMYGLCPATQPRQGHEWRATLWSGQMAVLLGTARIKADVDKPDGGSSCLERLIPRLLGVLRESPLNVIERTEAGRILAQLGDPRREVLLPEEMVFCEIPAGPFTMGSEDDPQADNNEEPQHKYNIPYNYKISCHPVTNAQFKVFVQAGGYENREYWHEAEKGGIWKHGSVRDFFDDSGRKGPFDFGDPFNLPNHPVVGVTWYEALAFTRWLAERLRETGKLLKDWEIRLPNEPEWEKSARGTDGRIYPWGNEMELDRINCNETGINATNAVGCFSSGASPYEVEEMSGNVWEWTRSLDAPYPYPEGVQERTRRERLEEGVDKPRVLRGGSFIDFEDDLRCAVRVRYDPYGGSGTSGFEWWRPLSLDSETLYLSRNERFCPPCHTNRALEFEKPQYSKVV
jgi:formylglycine-generating enzyme required for sulfatase activity